MNISNLEQYVEEKNKWRSIFGDAELTLLGTNDRKIIAQLLDSDLSPENLTCDGEASPTWVRMKHNFLIRCAQELVSIDPTVRIYELG